MYSIGIDAHKRYSQITIMQENGKIINRCKVNNDRKSIKRALSPSVIMREINSYNTLPLSLIPSPVKVM